MKKRDYGKHNCVLRKELDEFKRGLAEVWKVLREIQDEQIRQSEELRQIANRVMQPSVAEGQLAGEARQSDNSRQPETELQQPESDPSQTPQGESTDGEPTGSCMASNDVETVTITSEIQRQVPVDREIFVAGSYGRSCEIFNWSTHKWSLDKDMLFFDHTNGFSFVYETVDDVQLYEWIMICGGTETNRIECLNAADCNSVTAFPAQLPSTKCGKGVLCNDKILTFGDSITTTTLMPQFRTTKDIRFRNEEELLRYGVACVNQNAVVIVGGVHAYREGHYIKKEYLNSVKLYNPTTKTTKALAPLPYELCDMTVVVHEENVILVGGTKGAYGGISGDVLMYNITNQHCLKLPSMLEKSSRCAAVIVGNKLVAIGGGNEDRAGRHLQTQTLKTAEYLVLGEVTWRKLPDMHCERAGATAWVIPD